MAGHGPIYDKVRRLLATGRPLDPANRQAKRIGGPLNIGDMSRSIEYADTVYRSKAGEKSAALDLAKVRREAFDFYDTMRRDGFDCRRPGPAGPGQFEPFEGQNHAGFRFAAVALTLKVAIEAGHEEVVEVCEWWFASYMAAVREFNIGGKFAICAPRMKNPAAEDGEPADLRSDAKIKINQWRNPEAEQLYATVARGKKISPFFAEDLNLGSVLTPDRCARLSRGSFPGIALLIRRVNFPGGGYRCWFDDTPEARALLNVDGLTTVEMRPGMRIPKRRYDWRPMPPPKEGADWLAAAEVVTYGG